MTDFSVICHYNANKYNGNIKKLLEENKPKKPVNYMINDFMQPDCSANDNFNALLSCAISTDNLDNIKESFQMIEQISEGGALEVLNDLSKMNLNDVSNILVRVIGYLTPETLNYLVGKGLFYKFINIDDVCNRRVSEIEENRERRIEEKKMNLKNFKMIKIAEKMLIRH